MNPAGFPLLSFIVAGSLAAQEPPSVTLAESGATKISSRLTQEIRASLPPYTPPPPRVLDQPKDLVADPDIFALPKVTVREKRPPGHDPDLWLTDRSIQQKAMAAYKQSMTDLEWALNSWFIPILSPPASVRARGAYEYHKSLAAEQRLHRLVQDISLRDANASAELEQERVKMNQTEYWQSRPAGDGRKK